MIARNKPAPINSTDYVPKRFGLKYGTPPVIVLEYLIPSTGKLFHHKMKLRHIRENSTVEGVVEELKQKHADYLPVTRVSGPQLAGKATNICVE